MRRTSLLPDPKTSFTTSDGLMAIGGKIDAAHLLEAYSKGIFPWFSEDQEIMWWCPDPRAVMRPEQFHASRTLMKAIRSGRYRVSIDEKFIDVINSCAAPRDGDSATWITKGMKAAYIGLHNLGYAHSIEVWLDNGLCGGLYGVSLGKIFFAESMFSNKSNGSKIALYALSKILISNKFKLIDCQFMTPHLKTLGVREIPRNTFLDLLSGSSQANTNEDFWHLKPFNPAQLESYK